MKDRVGIRALAMFALSSLCMLLTSITASADFNTPLYQEPTVVSAMRQIWMYRQLGNDRKESTFVVHGRKADGSVIIRRVKDTEDYARETFELMPGDVAVFHTHPNVLDARPSAADKAIADKYGIAVYTVSRDGVWMYAPGMKNPVQVTENL